LATRRYQPGRAAWRWTTPQTAFDRRSVPCGPDPHSRIRRDHRSQWRERRAVGRAQRPGRYSSLELI